MSKKASYLLGILLTIIIGTLLYWWLCCCCCDQKKCDQDCKNKTKEKTTVVEKPKTKAATLHPFALKDGDFALNIKDNFNFKDSNFKILDPVSDDLKNSVMQLKEYLAKNPYKRINVTGYYTSKEKNNSAYPNLGLARANAIKNYMVSQGIPSRIINTYGKLKDDLSPDESNVYFGPVDYEIKTLAEGDTTEAEELKKLGEHIKANPLVLHFKTGQSSINLTAEQRQKIADISRYIDKVEGASCSVVGHTDNTGDPTNNIVLGQERADFAKQYLIRNAIPASKIMATSKGQTEPIADNSTEEGKAQNRRTVVTIN